MTKCAAPLKDEENCDVKLALDIEAQKGNICVASSSQAKTHLTDKTDENSLRNLSKSDEFQTGLCCS